MTALEGVFIGLLVLATVAIGSIALLVVYRLYKGQS